MLSCILAFTLLAGPLGGPADREAAGQSWVDFSHTGTPHGTIVTPAALQGSGSASITRPLLVVLMEFSDIKHRAHHTAAFWRDLAFGDPRTGTRPSLVEIYRENTNGRLDFVPATAGDSHDGSADGVVGWVAASQTAQQLSDVHKKRAEGIRVADPQFDYYLYDDDGNGIITANELTILVVLADNAPTGACCDEHIGHPDPPSCDNRCAGGNTRTTDPAQVDVDADQATPKKVQQSIAGVGEMTQVGTVAHELGHASYYLQDLYPIDANACQIYLQLTDGYICKFCDNCNDSCGSATCVEDGHRAKGKIADTTTGTDVTACGFNDTRDVWYSYTPAVTGSVTISLCNSDNKFDSTPTVDFDTTLAVFDACSGTQLACNDDFDCDGDGNKEAQSQVDVWMTAGVEYEIRIAGYDNATGGYTLDITGGAGDCGYAQRRDIWYPPSPEYFSLMGYYWTDYVPHMDPWAKIHLGFVKPKVVTHDGTYTLFDAETERDYSLQDSQPEALVIYDPLRDDPYREYFILENRNESQLNDQGLGVWLIDEDVPNWPDGLELRKVIQFQRRDGHWAPIARALWDGANPADGYDLNATSIPMDTAWSDGSPSYIEITNISSAGPQMTFDVAMPPIFVDKSNLGSEKGSQDKPYATVSKGVGAVAEPPRTIRIAGGTYAEPMVIDTPCTLKGWKNGSAVIGQQPPIAEEPASPEKD